MELTSEHCRGEETGAKKSAQREDSDKRTRDQSNDEYRYLKNSLTVKRHKEHVADAETMLHITSTLLESIKLAQQIKDSILPSQFIDVLLKTFRKVSQDDTGSIGREASAIFSEAPPGVPTMLGPMEIRASIKRRAAVNEKQGKTMEISQSQEVLDVDEEIKAEIERNMLAMVNILNAKKCVKLQALVLNRRSFAETVENLFALSFLVKDGRAEIKVAEDKSQIIVLRDVASLRARSDGDVINMQFMFRFDYKDWELMRDQVQVGEELMEHRSSTSDDADEPLPRNVQIAWPLVIPKGVRNKVRRRTAPVAEAEMHDESPEKGSDVPVIATESPAIGSTEHLMEPARGKVDYQPNRSPVFSCDTRSQDKPRQERVSGEYEASAMCEEPVEDEMSSRKRMRVAGNGDGVMSRPAVDDNSLCIRDAQELQEESAVRKSPRKALDTPHALSSGNHQDAREGAVGGEELRNNRMPEETVNGGDESCCEMPHAGRALLQHLVSAALGEQKSATRNGTCEDNGCSEEEKLVTISKPRATQLLTYSRRRPREKPPMDEVGTLLPQNTFDIIKKYTRRALTDDETHTNNEASSLYKKLVGIPIKKRIGRISCGSDDAEAIFERLASAPKRKRTSYIESPTNQVERSAQLNRHQQSSHVGGSTGSCTLNAPRRYRKSLSSKKPSSEASSPKYKLKDDDASGGEDVQPLVIAPKRFKKSALDPRQVLVAKVKARLKAIFKQSQK